jgi:hypothetical protein
MRDANEDYPNFLLPPVMVYPLYGKTFLIKNENEKNG